MKRKNFTMLVLTMMILIFSTKVYAHYLWLTVDDYNPNPGQEITISVGWGHKFPTDGQPRPEMIKKMNLFLIKPSGKKDHLKIIFKESKGIEPVKIKLKKQGIYLAVLTINTYVSKTVEGYFYKPKNELKDVIQSKWLEATAIAIINVGKIKNNFVLKGLKDFKYQIVPLKNPLALKKGEVLPVKIIYKDKPFRTWVYATYAGFSEYKDTFAWTTRTDKEGIAKIKILEKGVWLVKTDTNFPYPDSTKADKCYFITTLTFGL